MSGSFNNFPNRARVSHLIQFIGVDNFMMSIKDLNGGAIGDVFDIISETELQRNISPNKEEREMLEKAHILLLNKSIDDGLWEQICALYVHNGASKNSKGEVADSDIIYPDEQKSSVAKRIARKILAYKLPSSNEKFISKLNEILKPHNNASSSNYENEGSFSSDTAAANRKRKERAENLAREPYERDETRKKTHKIVLHISFWGLFVLIAAIIGASGQILFPTMLGAVSLATYAFITIHEDGGSIFAGGLVGAFLAAIISSVFYSNSSKYIEDQKREAHQRGQDRLRQERNQEQQRVERELRQAEKRRTRIERARRQQARREERARCDTLYGRRYCCSEGWRPKSIRASNYSSHLYCCPAGSRVVIFPSQAERQGCRYVKQLKRGRLRHSEKYGSGVYRLER